MMRRDLLVPAEFLSTFMVFAFPSSCQPLPPVPISSHLPYPSINQSPPMTYRGAKGLGVLLRGQGGDLQVLPHRRHQLGRTNDLWIKKRRGKGGIMSVYDLLTHLAANRPACASRSRTFWQNFTPSFFHVLPPSLPTNLGEMPNHVAETLLDVAQQERRAHRLQFTHGAGKGGGGHAAVLLTRKECCGRREGGRA